MSAQLAGVQPAALTNHFTAHLALAAGVHVSVNAPTLGALSSVIALLQPTEAANEAPGKLAATAPAGSPATQIAAPSALAAAAPAAGDAGNVPASTATPASAQPAASGSAPAGEAEKAGNVAAAASPSPAAAAASTASSSEPAASPAVSFDELKKAFLALSTKADGRAKCEAVLKSVTPAPAKLSAATPEQYGALLGAIQKASA